MNMRRNLLATVIVGAVFSASSAMAAVSAEEAAQLNSTLTPMGAEKAGNADGTIPAWDGGYTKPLPGYTKGGRRGDPFADEKPLFSITADNMDQYADKLSEGQQAMLKKYSDSYRIDVYPTHRTAAAPQWVYDNTYKNAVNGKMSGEIPENVYGGVPFPIPQSAEEVIWNHRLRWRGTTTSYETAQYQLTPEGRAILISKSAGHFQYPYYFQDGSAEEFDKSKEYWVFRAASFAPANRAGEAIVLKYNFDGDKDAAWFYLVGQRRVRKIPTASYDSPDPQGAGLTTFDEHNVWLGPLDRFNWKLIGKREMYIPYNSNRILQPTDSAEVIGPHSVKPEYLRWELHRVWEVEATLKDGERHLAPKSRYYCDEDSWNCVMADRWDGNGDLWKTIFNYNIVVPDAPAVVAAGFQVNELLSDQVFVQGLMNDMETQFDIEDRIEDGYFSGDALTGDSIR